MAPHLHEAEQEHVKFSISSEYFSVCFEFINQLRAFILILGEVILF